jgi:hypothetical protein
MRSTAPAAPIARSNAHGGEASAEVAQCRDCRSYRNAPGEIGPLTAEPSPTALTLGLEDGVSYGWAHLSDRAGLGRIARAHAAVEVVENVDATFRIPDGVDDRVAYWSGFAHGVLRVLRESVSAPSNAQS